MTTREKHIGSSLDDFLKEEGDLEETRAIALKSQVELWGPCPSLRTRDDAELFVVRSNQGIL